MFDSAAVAKAMNEHQEEFTQARLIEVVKDARTQPASAIVQRISAVAEHRSGLGLEPAAANEASSD